MKPFKTILAGIALIGAAASALAEPSTDATIVRLTGSTAFRTATHSAIVALYDSAPVAGYVGSNLSGSSRSFFYGQIDGQPVIITTFWSGSVGGIRAVAQGVALNFLPDNLADAGQPTLATAGPSASGGTVSSGNNLQIPDVAMSDTFQAATPFKTPVLSTQKVGVIGFKWLVNRGTTVVTTTASSVAASAVLTVADATGLAVGMTAKSSSLPAGTVAVPVRRIASIAGNQVTLDSGTGVLDGTSVSTNFAAASPISNINPQLAQALWSNGTAKLALFTGNAADTGVTVYATGRDPDSGTRLTAFAETGIGVDSTVTQFRPTVSGTTVTAVAPYPAGNINGIPVAEGNSGESSGGTLAGYFGHTTAGINGYLVSYVGAADAPAAVAAGAKELNYSGVPYGDGTSIKEGLYSFWCYEHVLYPSTWATAAGGSVEAHKKAIADAMGEEIRTNTAPIKLTEMNCSRTADGGVVFHN